MSKPLKLAAALISLASGFRGGLFFASLFMGALIGKIYGAAAAYWLPSITPDATVCALAGMGAIRHLAPDHGELKSMRVAPSFLRQGVGKAMLRHLLNVARARGYARVSLETGRGEAFDPAIALYRRHGFVDGPAFADYVLDGFSQCLTLAL